MISTAQDTSKSINLLINLINPQQQSHKNSKKTKEPHWVPQDIKQNSSSLQT